MKQQQDQSDAPQVIGRMKTPFGVLTLLRTRYQTGRSPVVLLEDRKGDFAGVLSVNLIDYEGLLKENEFFVKTWSENEDLIAPALATGLFEDTGSYVETGFVRAPIWRLVK